MKDMIESSVYRSALDRLDIAKKALRQISKFESSEGYMARRALETIADADVIDEIPGAYKSIQEVMDNQSDLVEIVAELKQIVCVKG